jgi:hypothetical protein
LLGWHAIKALRIGWNRTLEKLVNISENIEGREKNVYFVLFLRNLAYVSLPFTNLTGYYGQLSKISITKLKKVAKIIREALCSDGWEGVRPVIKKWGDTKQVIHPIQAVPQDSTKNAFSCKARGANVGKTARSNV